jgi:hypothetical protein
MKTVKEFIYGGSSKAATYGTHVGKSMRMMLIFAVLGSAVAYWVGFVR